MTTHIIRKTGPGFTLIELLVVIAIIGLLGALLLPVVNNSLRKGYTATSINNLKQIHTMVTIYAGDNRDRYPLPYNGTSSWRRVVWEHSTGQWFSNADEMNNSAYNKVMWCPLMVKKYDSVNYVREGHGSYAMNPYFETMGPAFAVDSHFIGVSEPYIALGDVDGSVGTNHRFKSALPSEANNWEHLSYEHGSGDLGLGLFVDGHVEPISVSRAEDLQEYIGDENILN